MLLLKDHTRTQDSPSERRRGLRIHQNRPIKIFEPTGAKYFGGQTEDVSATGLRVTLPASSRVMPGKLLNIHVGLDQNTGQALANRRQMIPARVVWIEPSGSHESRMQVGLEFLASIAAHLDAA